MSRPRSACLNVIALAGVALLGGTLDAGCARNLGPSAGDVRLALALPQGSTANTVTYLVLSSSGATMAGPGTLDVSASGATLTLQVIVPATLAGDPGDTVKLSATTSAAFPVPAGGSVSLGMTLACGTASEAIPTGNVGVTATVVEGDHCPSITSGVASPATTSLGGSIEVAATASDADPGDTLTYAWAPAANFTNPAASTTIYRCLSGGTEAFTLTVSDNHTPPCLATATFTVRCRSVDDDGDLCGDGVVGPSEQCDPPNGTTCSSTCQLVGGAAGASATGGMGGMAGGAGMAGIGGMAGSSGPAVCGNGIIEPGESCDPPAFESCDQSCQNIIHDPICATCGLNGTNAGTCFLTSVPGQGMSISNFGCYSLTNATDRANCLALVGCLRGAACQDAIKNATPDYVEMSQGNDNPLPCLCGNIPLATCELEPDGWTGVCAAQYTAAALWDHVNAVDSFYDPTTPLGVANNLFTCDIDNACQTDCGFLA